LELIERNWDCVRRRMVFSFGIVGLVPSLENTKNKDLTPETPPFSVRLINLLQESHDGTMCRRSTDVSMGG